MIQKSRLIHFHSLRAVSMPNKVISGPRKNFDLKNIDIQLSFAQKMRGKSSKLAEIANFVQKH